MMRFAGLGPDEAAAFCARWLPAWTGHDADRLADFYAEDAFYADPARPAGLHGRVEIRAYFQMLLRRYPDWVWTHRRSLPLPDGFLNFWRASLTGRADAPTFDGACTVQLRDGRIVRNEVFFDRTVLLEARRG